METEKLLELLEYDDLSVGLKLIADTLGLEAVKKLLIHQGGEEIYIQYPNHIIPLVRRYIANEIKNSAIVDVKRVALDLNLSKPYVNLLIKKFYAKTAIYLNPLNDKRKCTRSVKGHYKRP